MSGMKNAPYPASARPVLVAVALAISGLWGCEGRSPEGEVIQAEESTELQSQAMVDPGREVDDSDGRTEVPEVEHPEAPDVQPSEREEVELESSAAAGLPATLALDQGVPVTLDVEPSITMSTSDEFGVDLDSLVALTQRITHSEIESPQSGFRSAAPLRLAGVLRLQRAEFARFFRAVLLTRGFRCTDPGNDDASPIRVTLDESSEIENGWNMSPMHFFVFEAQPQAESSEELIGLAEDAPVLVDLRFRGDLPGAVDLAREHFKTTGSIARAWGYGSGHGPKSLVLAGTAEDVRGALSRL